MIEAITGVVGTRFACSFRWMDALHDKRYDMFFQCFWTKVAGVAILAGHKYSCCAFQAVYAAVYPGHTDPHAKTVQAVACPSVVYTTYNDIHLA